MRKIRFRRGAVWLGEIPATVHFLGREVTTEYRVRQVIETSIENMVSGVDNPRSAALQLSWATGGQGHWAFLGATFQPLASTLCVVQIGVSSDETGLVAGLAQAVNEQAKITITKRKDPWAGIIRFERAINHPIDSSPKLFRLATECLIKVLEPNCNSLSDKNLADVLERTCQALSDPDMLLQ